MGRTRVPFEIAAELRAVLEDIYLKLDRMTGINNVDWHGRRIINAGRAQHDGDYVTLLDMKNFVTKATGKQKGPILGSQGAGSGGGGGTGAGCQGMDAPTVDAPDDFDVVEAYAAANPAQLAASCQDSGGTWDFMDGVVAALQAVDSRYGYNAKRGNCEDPSHDAISYYYGELGVQTACSRNCYVFDIIAGHCGDNPQPAWINVTNPSGDCGGWLPTR